MSAPSDAAIGKKVQQARLAKGLTTRTLANRLGWRTQRLAITSQGGAVCRCRGLRHCGSAQPRPCGTLDQYRGSGGTYRLVESTSRTGSANSLCVGYTRGYATGGSRVAAETCVTYEHRNQLPSQLKELRTHRAGLILSPMTDPGSVRSSSAILPSRPRRSSPSCARAIQDATSPSSCAPSSATSRVGARCKVRAVSE